MKKSICVLIALFACMGLFLCGCGSDNKDLWQSAVYREDTEIGSGTQTIIIVVEAGEKSVTLTVHTDKDNLGDALMDLNLIEGEEGDYGLYVKTVNGILADYDSDKTFWSLYINDEYAMTSADQTSIEDGAEYRWEYTK